MCFALPCLSLILTTLALAELTVPEKELANLELARLQQEAELVDFLTLPEECQQWVRFYFLANLDSYCLRCITIGWWMLMEGAKARTRLWWLLSQVTLRSTTRS